MSNGEPWQQWARRDIDGGLVDRARGVLPEMECTKQLVRLVSEIYRPGMSVLDVGCNAGHYLTGLRRIDPNMNYLGVDVNPRSIENAREIFATDPNARFEVKDIRQPLDLGAKFDIVFCCNVILHLPDFRPPLRSLLESTKGVCIIRTLLEERSTLARRLQSHNFAEEEEPADFYYMNTWARDVFVRFADDLGWRTELLADEYDACAIAAEYDTVKQGDGTRMVAGMQADGAVIYNWRWARLTEV